MQLPLFEMAHEAKKLSRDSFSHGGVCPQSARLGLEERYAVLLEETNKFDRRLVSYQGNKGEILHSWIKYREGFSAQLVAALIREFDIHPGNTLLEPFSGSATTLLVAKAMGIDAIGIEILPVCHLAWQAKSCVYEYNSDELRRVYGLISEMEPGKVDGRFPHITITESAFPPQIEQDLMFYTEWYQNLNVSGETKTLLKLALTSILEEVSYTRKDGQYLRWDSRAEKVKKRKQKRVSQGKKPIQGLDKGRLPSVKDALTGALATIIEDIEALQKNPSSQGSRQTLIRGSALTVLPKLDAEQFHGVITSPPYCNRYDYTRTYALELSYLGIGEQGIRALRQSQLSCTVENRSKLSLLKKTYEAIGQPERFSQVLGLAQQNPALKEINEALHTRWDREEINNKGILSMVEGYFTELSFVFAEIFRTCRRGAHVAFVNDNVRYGGEIIPVDLLCTHLAEQIGFEAVKVYVLPQRKGNSSQQMGKFGREALRKSITIWRKP